MTANTTTTALDVTINNPDDHFGMPLFEGALNEAADVLIPGEYTAIADTADGDMVGTVTIAADGPATFTWPTTAKG